MMSKKIDLAGDWILRFNQHNIRATVPGDTHSALLDAGIIEDPYWSDNELKIQDYGRVNWIYEREFEVPPALFKEESIYLNFDSIDTIATVFVNGHKVGETKNAFLRYRFEAKPFLVEGKNHIAVEIKSPEIAALAEKQKLPYPAPHNPAPVQSPHRNLIRKTQCHAGWDWGLCMMVSGITGAVYLEGLSLARIESVRCEQQHHPGAVDLTVICEVFSPLGGFTEWSIQFDETQITTAVRLKPGINELRHTFQVKNPRLWWPNGFGAQPLYSLTIQVAESRVEKRVGLRDIEVIHQDDEQGHSMVFKVNQVPVFCKGASWIPADGFPQRQTRAVMDDLLSSAAAAHMNMIRVWGGGQYESDDFYDLCDEKGLLVWQDFMFACSVYPATPEFLENVQAEAEYQIKRLQSHPSLAIWCGNNENVGALNWYPETRANRDRYVVDYDRLNEGVIGNAVRLLDPTRLFWPSSPCGGPSDYSDCWHDDRRGDMHYWSVWFEAKPFEAVQDVRPRFCSEFGFQSFPSLETIRSYAPEDQWNVSSPVMDHHQRSDDGNLRIIQTFARYFRMPDGFENFVYLSQVQQTLALKLSIEHFRRIRPVCMGSIYWQLNDLWPVCSWSSLEYKGKWKILHYAAKRFYAPVLLSAFQTKDGHLEIWVNQDAGEATASEIFMQIQRFDGTITKEFRFPVCVPANGVVQAKRIPLSDLIDDPAQSFATFEMEVGGHFVRNEHLFCEYKKCSLEKAAIQTKIRQDGDVFSVELRCDRPAFWTTLEVSGIHGVFDDNGFLLLPNKPRTIRFYPKEPVSLETLQKQLSVRHLRDTYR